MHPSAMEFGTTALKKSDVAGKVVIEVGAVNVNGSLRDHIEAMGPKSYTGTDMQAGPTVDLVCPAEALPATGIGPADLVISTEMLEHAEDWAGAIAGMVQIMAPGALLLLTCRGPGFPRHAYPGDYWRFTPSQMSDVMEASRMKVIRCERDPGEPGLLLLARKPSGWRRPAGWGAALHAIKPEPAPTQ